MLVEPIALLGMYSHQVTSVLQQPSLYTCWATADALVRSVIVSIVASATITQQLKCTNLTEHRQCVISIRKQAQLIVLETERDGNDY